MDPATDNGKPRDDKRPATAGRGYDNGNRMCVNAGDAPNDRLITRDGGYEDDTRHTRDQGHRGLYTNDIRVTGRPIFISSPRVLFTPPPPPVDGARARRRRFLSLVRAEERNNNYTESGRRWFYTFVSAVLRPAAVSFPAKDAPMDGARI